MFSEVKFVCEWRVGFEKVKEKSGKITGFCLHCRSIMESFFATGSIFLISKVLCNWSLIQHFYFYL